MFPRKLFSAISVPESLFYDAVKCITGAVHYYALIADSNSGTRFDAPDVEIYVFSGDKRLVKTTQFDK